jgi:hypothetical protein
MNAIIAAVERRLRLLVGLALVFGVAGCASNRIDWSSRIGAYTLDQAILELGPPDKYAKLGDGTVVAEWLTRRGGVRGYPAFSGYPFYSGGPYYPSYYVSYPDYFLRLIFGPDGKLADWKQFDR